MHQQISPGLFVVRYAAPEDLAPDRQHGLVASLRAASLAHPVAVVFVLGQGVPRVGAEVPSFWLRTTSEPGLRLAAMAIVSPSAAVHVAVAGFGAANVVRGARFRVRAFAEERAGVSWASEVRRAAPVAQA